MTMTISREAMDAVFLLVEATVTSPRDDAYIKRLLMDFQVVDTEAAIDNIREHVRPGETKAILDLWAGIPLDEIEQARDAWCKPAAASAEAQPASTQALREVTYEDVFAALAAINSDMRKKIESFRARLSTSPHQFEHECPEWDGLRINPSMPEWGVCGCFVVSGRPPK